MFYNNSPRQAAIVVKRSYCWLCSIFLDAPFDALPIFLLKIKLRNVLAMIDFDKIELVVHGAHLLT